MFSLNKQPKSLILSRLPSFKHNITKPLANSTQINYTLSTQTSFSNDNYFTDAAVNEVINNLTSKTLDCTTHQTIHKSDYIVNLIPSQIKETFALNNTSPIKQTSFTPNLSNNTSEIKITDHFFDDKIINSNISDIPLPEIMQPNTDGLLLKSQATENISFYTSVNIPILTDADIQHRKNNHIICNAPPKSPIEKCYSMTRRQPGFKLNRIYIENSSCDN